MLVFDADKTLAPHDAGSMFWKRISISVEMNAAPATLDDPMKDVFDKLGYTYSAFRQAAMLYEEAAGEANFDEICAGVAKETELYPEILAILRRVAHVAATSGHVGVVVVTCGLKRVWEKVLNSYGLSDTIAVIGGGRFGDGYVVTPSVKAAIVARLQQEYHTLVWAFGDGPLDLEMLCKADKAIVIVGDQNSRSKSMDAKMASAINDLALKAHQALLPSTVSARLDTKSLPVVDLTRSRVLETIFRKCIFHATNKNAGKLLATPMRNAMISGPALREAHHRTAYYLANEVLSELIGVETFESAHVQGGFTDGWRIRDEAATTIVALMRGGAPMAPGVSEALPAAMFVHARKPDELQFHHIEGQETIILVDSVINGGTSALECIQHIRKSLPKLRIVIVAGVAQAQCIREGAFAQWIRRDLNLYLITLRFSVNKYTGTKGIDTGKRLFNTIHLD